MRKLVVIFVVVMLLLVSSLAFASVGIKKDGVNEGAVTDIDFRSSHTSKSGSVVSVYANGYKDGVTTNVSTESHLTSAALAYGIVSLVGGTSAKTMSLEAGTDGQIVTIIMTPANSGSITISETCVNPHITSTGWTSIVFAVSSSAQSVTLLWVDDTYGWILVGSSNVTIS